MENPFSVPLDNRSRKQPSEARSKSENKSMKMGVALQKCRCYGKLCFIKQLVKSGMGFISYCISPEFFATQTFL